MKRKYINIALIVLFSVVSFFSCVAPIDISTRDSEQVIVIYGQLTDQLEYQFIRITSSSPYFDNKTNIVISDAEVIVTSSDGEEYRFIGEKDGYYISENKFAICSGNTYYLKVEVDFDKDGVIDTYEAETTVFPVIPIDSIDVIPINIMGYNHFSLNLYMLEPAETENYYLFRFFINDSISNNKISELIVSEDEMYNGVYLSGISIYYFEDAEGDSPYADEERDYYVKSGDIIRLQVLNIEKGYYHFINECISEKYGENPFFGGPPSNITTNISNGAVGYFSGYCLQERSTIVP